MVKLEEQLLIKSEKLYTCIGTNSLIGTLQSNQSKRNYMFALIQTISLAQFFLS